MSTDVHKLSTSALARLLDIPLPQLFNTLKDYGWIRKIDDGWVLTGKGEYEGGEYIQSKKYGRYIVWPEAIVEHPLIRGVTEHRLLTLGAIGKTYQLSGREIARIFAEQGLLQTSIFGWQPTESGRQAGMTLAESDHYGQSYILCPQEVVERDSIATLLRYLQVLDQQINEGQQSLQESDNRYISLDGHAHISPFHQRVDDWLYLARIVHATKYRDLELFYLPQSRVLIDVWIKESKDISEHMKLAVKSDLNLVQIMPEDFADIDANLMKRLAMFGVTTL